VSCLRLSDWTRVEQREMMTYQSCIWYKHSIEKKHSKWMVESDLGWSVEPALSRLMSAIRSVAGRGDGKVQSGGKSTGYDWSKLIHSFNPPW
jgi:hypothetical protein